MLFLGLKLIYTINTVTRVIYVIPLQNWNKPREFDCLIKTKHCDGLYAEDGDTMWFLPSALNVKVERFQASTG